MDNNVDNESKNNHVENANIKEKYVRPVVVSVVCTLFILPIASSILATLKIAGGNIFTALVDYFYRSSANTTAETAVLFFCNIAMSLLIGTTIGRTLTKIYELHSTTKRNRSSHVPNIDNAEDTSIEKIYSDLATLKFEIEKEKKTCTRLGVTSVVMDIILVVTFIFVIAFYIYPAGVNIRFNQKIDVISPYVTSETVLQLKSDWARMEKQSDYIAITDKITSIYNDNKLN